MATEKPADWVDALVPKVAFLHIEDIMQLTQQKRSRVKEDLSKGILKFTRRVNSGKSRVLITRPNACEYVRFVAGEVA